VWKPGGADSREWQDQRNWASANAEAQDEALWTLVQRAQPAGTAPGVGAEAAAAVGRAGRAVLTPTLSTAPVVTAYDAPAEAKGELSRAVLHLQKSDFTVNRRGPCAR